MSNRLSAPQTEYICRLAKGAVCFRDPRKVETSRFFRKCSGPAATVMKITTRYRHDDHYWWEMAKRLYRIPAEFLDGTGCIEYSG